MLQIFIYGAPTIQKSWIRPSSSICFFTHFPHRCFPIAMSMKI